MTAAELAHTSTAWRQSTTSQTTAETTGTSVQYDQAARTCALAARVLLEHLAWLDSVIANRYEHARGDLDDCRAHIRAALAALEDKP